VAVDAEVLGVDVGTAAGDAIGDGTALQVTTASLNSYGHRMLNRMMKKTTQGVELDTLKKEYQELLEENSQLKERIEELENKVCRNFKECSRNAPCLISGLTIRGR
jgi:predicted RNase H-like nuclease (RuvC/YqgF family)